MRVGKPSVGLFPKRLRQVRERIGMSQIALGERLGVSRTTIQGWERGDKSPAMERLDEIADALGCAVVELFQEDVAPAEPLAPTAHAPPTSPDLHSVLVQLTEVLSRLEAGQRELREGQAQLRRAVEGIAAQEQGTSGADARRPA